MPSTPTYATVENEDCKLHYWYQGNGPLLIFVPGGNGYGRQYNAIIGILETQYTVATFDRRQMPASQVKGPKKQFNPIQQARDVIAVMKAIGRETTSVFASSGGGIIAYQMAVSYPKMLDHLICHEAPTTSLLSAEESTEIMDFFFKLQDIYREGRVKPTLEAFTAKIMVGMDDGLPRRKNDPGNSINQFENEMMMGWYCPDLVKIVQNQTSMAVGFGTKSEGAIYKRTALEQAKRLGCEAVEFPGHHQGFETQADEFSPLLVDLLGRMEERRRLRLEG